MRPRTLLSRWLLVLGTFALYAGLFLQARAALIGRESAGPHLALAGFAVLVVVFLANLAAEQRRERGLPYVWAPPPGRRQRPAGTRAASTSSTSGSE